MSTVPKGAMIVPEAPPQMPSLSSSDDESFVVLGKSLIPEDASAGSDDHTTVVDSAVVDEARRWISNEIHALELEEQKVDEADGRLLKKGGDTDTADDARGPSKEKKDSLNSFVSVASALERSAIFPEMPKVESGFDTPISIASITSNLSSEEVQTKVAQIIEENMKLKDTILQNNISLKSQYDRIVAWQEEVQKVYQAHKDKIYEAKACIEKLKKDKENLALELEKQKDVVCRKNEIIKTLQETLASKESNASLNQTSNDNLKEFELEMANKKIKDLECENQKLKDENADLLRNIESLKEAAKPTEERIRKLQGDLDIAKTEIEQYKLEANKGKIVLRERETELGQIIAGLREQLSNAKPVDPWITEELDNTRTQLSNTQIMLTLAEENKKAALAKVDSLSEQVLRLNKEIEELKVKNVQSDEMFALKTQMDMYKVDFEQERSAKEAMKLEKDKLLEDIQMLQTRNQQLQDELAMARSGGDFVVLPRAGQTTSTNSSQNTSSSTSNRYARDLPHIRSSYLNSSPLRRNILTRSYLRTPIRQPTMKCPKCNFGFTTMQALENHVYRCIELDDQIP
ncbi:unnamed protein product [Callosobruchus maculatus]|uniref:NF-kappa-B essential modulator NEMO CC2-LZ domain-containing protein n=1 Tax=Callosobruchus maculatus TaxID=64391 RepID=A0A653DDT1_CALMS|nr:unnamed protein product [Callosobruchus maculatus]